MDKPKIVIEIKDLKKSYGEPRLEWFQRTFG